MNKDRVKRSPDYAPLLVVKKDPFVRLLVDRLHVSPMWMSLICFLVSVVLHIGLAWHSGHLFSRNGIVGSFSDWGFRFVDFLTIPAFGYFYIWTALAPNKLYTDLRDSHVFDLSVDDWEKLNNIYSSQIWLPIALLLTLMFTATIVAARSLAWWTSGVFYYFVVLTWYMLCLYMACMISARTISTTINLRRLFRSRTFYLRLFRPDKASDLGMLGKYALTITYLIVMSGLGIVGWEYSVWFKGSLLQIEGLSAHFTLFAYAVVALVCFFSPLVSTHKAMREAKKRALIIIADKMQRIFTDGEFGPKVAERFELLQSIYISLDENIPTWPFDTFTFRKFTVAVLSPFGALTPILFDTILKTALNRP